MWKLILDLLWQALHITEDLQRNRQDIKALEKRVFDLAAENERKVIELQLANERHTQELSRQRELAEAERKLLKLEIENYLLRQERGLPIVEHKQLSTPSNENESTQ
ncbi:MAG: hypothetical protein SF097_12965 [Acidobacteriota bacterium]|nr:hypothetical protein [Acidobacteriota bacterium]